MSLMYYVCVLCVCFKCLDLKKKNNPHSFNRGLIPEPFKILATAEDVYHFGKIH